MFYGVPFAFGFFAVALFYWESVVPLRLFHGDVELRSILPVLMCRRAEIYPASGAAERGGLWLKLKAPVADSVFCWCRSGMECPSSSLLGADRAAFSLIPNEKAATCATF